MGGEVNDITKSITLPSNHLEILINRIYSEAHGLISKILEISPKA
jgi:hypothetical protein